MGKDSGIEWTHHTFNPVWGCVKVSDGCKNCYAETLSLRFGNNIWGPPSTTHRRQFGPKHWAEPRKWDREAKSLGIKARVFCASMADIAESHTDWIEPRKQLVRLIWETPNLIWLLLTKRIGDFMELFNAATMAELGISIEQWLEEVGENVWVGTSVENQKTADERIPILQTIPVKVRFLSMEPLLGYVDLWEARYLQSDGSYLGAITTWRNAGIQWVIVGGESGPGARPMKADWARDIIRVCEAAGVPCFFKQWGEWVEGSQPIDDPSFAGGQKIVFGEDGFGVSINAFNKTGTKYCEFEGSYFWRAGKKEAGRLFGGKEYSEFPGQRLIDILQ